MTPKDNAASLRRRKHIENMRAEVDAIDQRRGGLAEVIKKLRAAKGRGAALWDTEVEQIIRALDSKAKRRRGAPEQLAFFHKWIAAHALSHGGKYESMVLEVRAVWGVSKAAIDRAVKDHRAEARTLLAALGSDEGIKQNIGIMADAYHALAK